MSWVQRNYETLQRTSIVYCGVLSRWQAGRDADLSVAGIVCISPSLLCQHSAATSPFLLSHWSGVTSLHRLHSSRELPLGTTQPTVLPLQLLHPFCHQSCPVVTIWKSRSRLAAGRKPWGGTSLNDAWMSPIWKQSSRSRDRVRREYKHYWGHFFLLKIFQILARVRVDIPVGPTPSPLQALLLCALEAMISSGSFLVAPELEWVRTRRVQRSGCFTEIGEISLQIRWVLDFALIGWACC